MSQKSKKTIDQIYDKLDQIERRLRDLEKVSHKQPDMKLMLKDAMKLLKYADKNRDDSESDFSDDDDDEKNTNTSDNKSQKIRRPPNKVRC